MSTDPNDLHRFATVTLARSHEFRAGTTPDGRWVRLSFSFSGLGEKYHVMVGPVLDEEGDVTACSYLAYSGEVATEACSIFDALTGQDGNPLG